jgi:biotin carboxyl carrier protein
MTKSTDSREQSAAAPLSYHDAMQILNIVKSTQNCSSIRLKFAGTTISLERDPLPASAIPPAVSDERVTRLPAATQATATGGAVAPDTNGSAASQFADIKAPMVGFFHHPDGADGSVALEVGVQVRPTDAIGMIKARRFSEPVLAAVSGELMELLVEHADFVEYGQIVARVKLDS